MRAKPPLQSGFCIIPAVRTRSAKCMMAMPPWTGWSKSKSAASPLPLLRQPVSGSAPKMAKPRQANMAAMLKKPNSALISLIHPATWISPLRLSVHWLFWMARYVCWMPMPVLSRRQKPYGARLTVIKCRALCSSTRWIKSAPTSLTVLR